MRSLSYPPTKFDFREFVRLWCSGLATPSSPANENIIGRRTFGLWHNFFLFILFFMFCVGLSHKCQIEHILSYPQWLAVWHSFSFSFDAKHIFFQHDKRLVTTKKPYASHNLMCGTRQHSALSNEWKKYRIVCPYSSWVCM